jgi:hypothetical protein
MRKVTPQMPVTEASPPRARDTVAGACSIWISWSNLSSDTGASDGDTLPSGDNLQPAGRLSGGKAGVHAIFSAGLGQEWHRRLG